MTVRTSPVPGVVVERRYDRTGRLVELRRIVLPRRGHPVAQHRRTTRGPAGQ